MSVTRGPRQPALPLQVPLLTSSVFMIIVNLSIVTIYIMGIGADRIWVIRRTPVINFYWWWSACKMCHRVCSRFPSFSGHREDKAMYGSRLLVQFSSRCCLCIEKNPYTLHPISQKFFHLVFFWLTKTFSCPLMENHWVRLLSIPLSHRWSMVWGPWLCPCR